MSEEELAKIKYMKELEGANINDKKLVDNLKYMMEVGYLNFRVNLALL